MDYKEKHILRLPKTVFININGIGHRRPLKDWKIKAGLP